MTLPTSRTGRVIAIKDYFERQGLDELWSELGDTPDHVTIMYALLNLLVTSFELVAEGTELHWMLLNSIKVLSEHMIHEAEEKGWPGGWGNTAQG